MKFTLTLKNEIPIEDWPLSACCIGHNRILYFFTGLFNQISDWPYRSFKGISIEKYNASHGAESIIWLIILNEVIKGNISFTHKPDHNNRKNPHLFFLTTANKEVFDTNEGIIEKAIRDSLQSNEMEIKDFTKLLSRLIMGRTVWNSLAHNYIIKKIIKEEVRFWEYSRKWEIPLFNPIDSIRVVSDDAIQDEISLRIEKISNSIISETKLPEFSKFCISLYTSLLISTDCRTSTVV